MATWRLLEANGKQAKGRVKIINICEDIPGDLATETDREELVYNAANLPPGVTWNEFKTRCRNENRRRLNWLNSQLEDDGDDITGDIV